MPVKLYLMRVGTGGRILPQKIAEFADTPDMRVLARTMAYERAYALRVNVMLTVPNFDPQIIAPFGD